MLFNKKINITIFLILSFNLLFAQNVDSLSIKQFLKLGDKYRIEGEYEKARDCALKALDINPNSGLAYFLIGFTYAQSADFCFEDEYEKKMVYCLVVDMFEKAKEVDSSVSERANELIKVYSLHFPRGPSEGVFISGINEGDKYKIECWINRETTIRFKD